MKLFVTVLMIWLLQSATAQPATKPIRGTWVTNVASDALLSKKNIRKTVRLCKKKGLNTLFVVVWNDGVTMYPSEVAAAYTGIKQHPVYNGFDPIRAIIKEGHRRGLQVHAWFEFGFSYAYKDTNSPWFQIKPHWQGKDNKERLLQKNGFYWWNALHPEVQQFMTSLVLEVVKKYDVDGIQGDDRLPAMPSEGGYDDFTQQLYFTETGKKVPMNHKDSLWLQWRADKLSSYGKQLYHEVKKLKPHCLVSWAPSIYPWSKEEYLQDWPAWLHGGYADFVMPQLYRYNLEAYEKILKELNSQVTAEQKRIVFPGILTGLADGYRISDEMLREIIRLNRLYGFTGECQFYFESLKTNKKMY